jgi:lysophospholipase L1-like esterase
MKEENCTKQGTKKIGTLKVQMVFMLIKFYGKMKQILIPAIAIGLGIFLASSRKINAKGMNVLFVGDSHTAGFGWGWQNKLALKYGFNPINISIGGASLPTMFNAMKKYYAGVKSVPLVFIYGGANDIYNGKTISETIQDLQEMVDFARSKGSDVIVICGFRSAVISANKNKTFVQNYDKFKEYLPSKISNAKVIPIWEDGVSTDSPDGFHLNADAQSRFADYIGDKILKK